MTESLQTLLPGEVTYAWWAWLCLGEAKDWTLSARDAPSHSLSSGGLKALRKGFSFAFGEGCTGRDKRSGLGYLLRVASVFLLECPSPLFRQWVVHM